MVSKRVTVRLEQLGDIVGGATPSTKNPTYWDGPIPWLSPKDLTGYRYRFIKKGKKSITQEGVDSCSTQLLPKGSVLFSSRAPIGYCAIAANPICTNQGFKSITPKKGIDSLFLYYLLLANKDAIASMGSGTTFPEISGKMMRQIEVTLPEDVKEQEAIARVLGSLDDKIELNNLINDYLEEMLIALQKNIAETEELVESRADELFSVHIGKTPPRKEPQWFSFEHTGNIIWMSIKDMGSGGAYLVDSSEYLTPEAVAKHNVKTCKPGSVLLSFKLTIGRVGIVANETTTNEAIACFSSDNSRKLAYLYPLLKTYDYASLGSTSSIATAVNSKMVKAMMLAMPSSEALDSFYEKARPIYEMLLSNTCESAALAELRDILLPKLMSGEIDVSKMDVTQLNNHLSAC